MKICTECGFENKDEAIVCELCGFQFENNPAKSAESDNNIQKAEPPVQTVQPDVSQSITTSAKHDSGKKHQ